MKTLLPIWARINKALGKLSPVLSTPWWPADRLESKQRALLRILRVAAVERLEVAPLVACLAQEHRGRFRRRLRVLAQRLAKGTPLANALEQTPGVVTDQQQLAIRFGERSGTLPTILTDLLERDLKPSRQAIARLRQIGFYASLVATLFVPVLTFFLIKIVPSFQAIMEDFSVELPKPMILLIGVCNFVSQFWYVFGLLIVFLFWLIRSEKSRRFFRRKLWSRILPPVAQLRTSDLLNLLSVSVKAGRPLAGALSTLARYHFDSLIRNKLLFVRNEIEQGADAWQSLAAARLLTPSESRALEDSTSSTSRAWSMNQLADLRRERVGGRLETVTLFLQAFVILAMAGAVFFVALACLSPLIEMISGLS